MKWCPNCQMEYRDGYEVCSDCGAALVEKPLATAPQPKVKPEAMRPKLVYSTYDRSDGEIKQAFLENAGIQVLFKEAGMGNSAQIYMGFASADFYLFVDERDYATARDLLDIYLNENIEADGDEAENQEYFAITNDYTGHESYNRRWFWLKVILGLLIVASFVIGIFGNFSL